MRAPEWRTELDTLSPEQNAILTGLYEKAEAARETFDGTIRAIADEAGGKPQFPPGLKGRKRASDKIATDYGGEASKIKDLLRATVVVESIDQIGAAIDAIKARFQLTPTGNRNLLTDEAQPVDGYRDAKFNVDLGGGLIAEVQVNLPQMVEAKNGRGHDLYEARQKIERGAAGREQTAIERSAIANLNAEMRLIYDPIWTQVKAAAIRDTASGNNSPKRSSETSPPLRRNESGGNQRGLSESSATNPPRAVSSTGIPSTSQSRTTFLTDIAVPPTGLRRFDPFLDPAPECFAEHLVEVRRKHLAERLRDWVRGTLGRGRRCVDMHRIWRRWRLLVHGSGPFRTGRLRCVSHRCIVDLPQPVHMSTCPLLPRGAFVALDALLLSRQQLCDTVPHRRIAPPHRLDRILG